VRLAPATWSSWRCPGTVTGSCCVAGAELAGKVVVDCVNPLGFDKQGRFALPVEEGSAAQQAAAVLPDSRVVGAFHHVSAVLLLDEQVERSDTDVLVLGDDREATDLVQALGRSSRACAASTRPAAQRPPGRGADRQPHLGQPPLQGARRCPGHRRLTTRGAGRRPPRVRRVVSLVPSLTEAVAVTAPGLLVGATDWCTHPPARECRGSAAPKNPRVAGTCSTLQADLVSPTRRRSARLDVADPARAGRRGLGDGRR
jgi:hypothetical protein